LHSANAFFSNVSMFVSPSFMQAPLFSYNSTSAVNFAGLGHVIGQQTVQMIGRSVLRDTTYSATSGLEDLRESLSCLQELLMAPDAQGQRSTRNVTIEDLADVVGLQAAFKSFPREGRHLGNDKLLSEEKLFFAASCYKFCGGINDGDVIGPGTAKTRCNVPLMNMAAFAAEFQCNASSYMNPPKKCAI
ncbi:unnamed protein product, partial [Ixodes hexagonus]